MYDYELFIRALVVSLKLSEVGQVVNDVCYCPILHSVEIYFSRGRKASITIKTDRVLPALDLMQIVIEVIRKETGGGENEN